MVNDFCIQQQLVRGWIRALAFCAVLLTFCTSFVGNKRIFWRLVRWWKRGYLESLTDSRSCFSLSSFTVKKQEIIYILFTIMSDDLYEKEEPEEIWMRNKMTSLNGNCIFHFYMIPTVINFEEDLKRNKWKNHIQCIYDNCCAPAISVLST